jgi:hypothetical protein
MNILIFYFSANYFNYFSFYNGHTSPINVEFYIIINDVSGNVIC